MMKDYFMLSNIYLTMMFYFNLLLGASFFVSQHFLTGVAKTHSFIVSSVNILIALIVFCVDRELKRNH